MDKRAYSTKRLRFAQKKPRRKSPTRLLVLLIALLVLFYLIGLISRSLGGIDTSALEKYVADANRIAERSNRVAKGFDGLKSNVAETSRKELKSRLLDYAKESKKISEDCKKIEVPDDLQEAHTYLKFCLELRAEGLEKYTPALFNALKDNDPEVASGQISLALKDLALSDRVYVKYSSESKDVLKKYGVKASITLSKFLAQDTAYEKTSILPYIQELKGAKSLEEVHGIGLLEMSTDPKQIKFISSKKLAVLPAADTVSVTVVVENQGNQVEMNVPVIATLKSETEPKEQKKQAYFTSLAPGEKRDLTISGLRPTQDSDVVNLLTVTAGPVPNEKFTDNNVNEYKFIME